MVVTLILKAVQLGYVDLVFLEFLKGGWDEFDGIAVVRLPLKGVEIEHQYLDI